MKPTIEEVRRAIERYMGTGEYGAAAIAAIDVAEALTDSRFWTNVVSMCPVTQELRDRAAERLQESASRTNDAAIAFAATIATRKPEGT